MDVVCSVKLQSNRYPGGARTQPRPSEGRGPRGHGGKCFVSDRRDRSSCVRYKWLGLHVCRFVHISYSNTSGFWSNGKPMASLFARCFEGKVERAYRMANLSIEILSNFYIIIFINVILFFLLILLLLYRLIIFFSKIMLK